MIFPSPQVKEWLLENKIHRCDETATLLNVRDLLARALGRDKRLEVFDKGVCSFPGTPVSQEIMISLLFDHGDSTRVVHLTGVVSRTQREIELAGPARPGTGITVIDPLSAAVREINETKH